MAPKRRATKPVNKPTKKLAAKTKKKPAAGEPVAKTTKKPADKLKKKPAGKAAEVKQPGKVVSFTTDTEDEHEEFTPGYVGNWNYIGGGGAYWSAAGPKVQGTHRRFVQIAKPQNVF